MTCGDVERLLDAFIDRELPPPMLLEVARHASDCSPCDETLRQFAALGEAVGGTVASEVDALDLSGIWPSVSQTIRRDDARLRWRQRLRALPAWGVTFAAAASLAIWLRTPAHRQEAPAVAFNQAAVSRMVRPQQAVIDRLAGKHVAIRSEPKAGTTLIWVNHPVEEIAQ